MPLFKRSLRYPPLRASDVMSKPAVTVGEEELIDEVSKVMWNNGIGSVLIVNNENRLIGIITERDILYAASRQMFGKEIKAKSLMSKNLVTASPEDEIGLVVEKMRDFNVRHVPVVDSVGRPLGVISSRDILDYSVRLLSLFVRSP